MDDVRKRRRGIAVLAVTALALSACGRGDEDVAEPDGEGDEVATGESGEGDGGGGGDSRVAAGEFGDLGTVCQDGEGGGATDTGVTADEIRIGTVTDRGASFRSGLNKEMYDTAEAFVSWCNEHGGINGRELVLDDLDAKLFEYGDRVAEACENDFALVGGGAVFDDSDDGRRVDCGLANIPGYVVTPQARAGELQAQPLPNPVYEFPSQTYRRIQEEDESIDRFGLLWVDFGGPETVGQQIREIVGDLDYEMAYDQQIAPDGETGWSTFVREMKENDVQVVEMVGEPEYMTQLVAEMDVQGWYPEYIVSQPNMYDQKLLDEAGPSLGEDGIYVRTVFTPFSMADQEPAVADYLELMDTYNPDGKYPALLGAQGLSAWLLFARAASECGAELTRECVLDNALAVDEWTGGGLHGQTNPGNTEAGVCGLIMRVTSDGFVYDEDFTQPDQDIFNCDPENVMQLDEDYGVEAPPE